ncbi:MAG: fluoride efflux transporter CrcB [Saprospiraceae bacterium]|nr:fluoride efflux transporter CrcB [Saprospiraceae bacterium]
MEWIAVFLGGGLGSLVRYSIARFFSPQQFSFAWATLTANLISCIILGILISVFTKSDSPARLFWMVGFCGGFSTFSTFTAETYAFLQDGEWLLVFSNIFGSILICLLGLVIGVRLAS